MPNPSPDELANILRTAHTIAIVGASSDPSRPSHRVMAMLQEAGYQVIPVNPKETSILGQKAYASLPEIPQQVDIVDVFRRPEHVRAVAEEAIQIGAKVLWLQLGVVNEEAVLRAQAAGLTTVMNKCIAVVHHELHIPKK
jgi:predicted CoA-binding protein